MVVNRFHTLELESPDNPYPVHVVGLPYVNVPLCREMSMAWVKDKGFEVVEDAPSYLKFHNKNNDYFSLRCLKSNNEISAIITLTSKSTPIGNSGEEMVDRLGNDIDGFTNNFLQNEKWYDKFDDRSVRPQSDFLVFSFLLERENGDSEIQMAGPFPENIKAYFAEQGFSTEFCNYRLCKFLKPGTDITLFIERPRPSSLSKTKKVDPETVPLVRGIIEVKVLRQSPYEYDSLFKMLKSIPKGVNFLQMKNEL